mgnify:CR=1 FL=1
MNVGNQVEELFGKYKSDIERNLKNWMKENEYKEVDLTDEVIVDLMDEFLSFLSSKSEFGFVMNEIDKDGLMGEYEWCESVED